MRRRRVILGANEMLSPSVAMGDARSMDATRQPLAYASQNLGGMRFAPDQGSQRTMKREKNASSSASATPVRIPASSAFMPALTQQACEDSARDSPSLARAKIAI